MKSADGEPSSSIPTLTWDSVVNESPTEPDPSSTTADAPADGDAVPTASERISFDLQLDLGGAAATTPAADANNDAAVPPAATPLAAANQDPAASVADRAVPATPPVDPVAPNVEAPAVLTVDPSVDVATPPTSTATDALAPAPSSSVAISPEPPTAATNEAVVAPSAADVAPAAEPGIAAPPAAPESSPPVADTIVEPVGDPQPSTPPPPLPTIREATPVEPMPVTPSVAPPPAPDGVPVLAPQVATAPPSGAIQLPPSHQPDQTAMGRAIPTAIPTAPPTAAPRRRRRGRGLLALFFILLILGGIVAAAVIVGRPMLFPESEWDAQVEPYAEAIEEVRATTFVEPVEVVAEPAAAFATRANAQRLGEWESQLPVWRSLGLANGTVTVEAVDELLEGGSPAAYASSDGRVYYADDAAGAELDAALTGALVGAALDQEVRWSADQATRTLDGRSLVDAAVLAEQERVRSQTAFSAPLAPRDPARLAFLPPVLGYRSIAPAVFAGLLPADASVDAAAMERYAAVGDIAVSPSNAPVLPAGVTADGEAIAPDQSFWYLALAAYVDARTAAAASEAIVESSLVTATTDGVVCTYSTFSGGAVQATTTLRTALDAWAAAAPPAFNAAVTVHDDGTLQLRSCDPGEGFENGARFGTASELVGLRAAELATFAGVVDAGGSDAEVAAALDRLESTAIGVELATLSPDTSTSDLAAAAAAAVADVVTPPAAAPAPAVEE